MKYYIVDDDIAVVKTLERIITDRLGGVVVGCNTNADEAVKDVKEDDPDIVLVDFLMKEMDGVSLIKKMQGFNSNLTFIMISKVTDKSLVQAAYDVGVEFFINKPINVLEVERVTGNVAERIKLRKVVSHIQSAFGEIEESEDKVVPKKEQKNHSVDILLSALGIYGEKGTNDILKIHEYMVEHKVNYGKEVLDEVSVELNDSIKNIEQRVRRTIKKGLSNAATIRMEDPENDVNVIYAGYVFDHIAMKREMDFLKGVSDSGGRVSISKFMDGLVLYRNYIND
ncbi:MAG: response regulator [Lachnospiraceae bacterium]|nr:response regulator [Lachnospiraceae bacterium]